MQRTAFLLLGVILLLLPFHPFLSTFFSSLLPESASEGRFLISAWKEILLVCFFVVGSVAIWKNRKIHPAESLDVAIIFYAILALLTGIFFTGGGFPDNLAQLLWGAKYGLLFLFAFLFAAHLPLFSKQREWLMLAALIPAGGVIVFGLAQIFVLPENTLIHFGYNPQYGITEVGQGLSYCHKIENRITHEEFCRTQSTLSGPNELGAYLLLVLPLLAFRLRREKAFSSGFFIWLFLLISGGTVLLYTWSRSAWIGALAAAAALFAVRARSPRAAFLHMAFFGLGVVAIFAPALLIDRWDELKPIALLLSSLCLVLMLLLYYLNMRRHFFSAWGGAVFPVALFGLIVTRARADTFFWNIILRPSSSQGHWERWRDGFLYIVETPWGLGLGDAGPASARFANPGETGFLPESWYLQVGLEAGVMGLILFLVILLLLCIRLLKTPDERGLPLFLSLIGISAAALFLHSWESSVVSLTFWILAGIAIAELPRRNFFVSVYNLFTSPFRK